MSLSASRPSASVFDPSSRYLNRRDPSEKSLLQFSDEFLDPSDDISEWYRIQPYKRFRTIRYYKEQTGVKHEFILLLLQGEQPGDVTSHCRLERMGDPEHLFQTVYVDGTIAEDYIHAIPLGNPKSAGLTRNSELVLEITFPLTFDLRDALAISYGISKHRKAKRYTLMQYNCYFFSWTMILALARACLDLGGDRFLQHKLQSIRSNIVDSIDSQGSSRFHSVAYLLSNVTSTTPESGEEHPLDQAVKSRVHRIEFSNSITEALSGILWVDKLRARLGITLYQEVVGLAVEYFCLLDDDEVQNKPKEFETPDTQRNLNPNLEHVVCTVAEKAVEMGTKALVQRWYRFMEPASQDRSLVKQRLGRRAWYKLLRGFFRHSLELEPSDTEKKPETASSSLSRLVGSSMREYLLIPPSFILSICFRLILTGGIGVAMGVVQARVKYEAGWRLENDGDIRRKAAFIGGATKSAIIATTKTWAYSKGLEHRWIIEYASDRGLISDASRFHEIYEDETKVDCAALGDLGQALEFLSDGLRSIKIDERYRFNTLRRSLLTIFRNITDSCPPDMTLQRLWRLILLERFLNMMVVVAYNALEGSIGSCNLKPEFWAGKIFNRDEPSRVAILPVGVKSHEEDIVRTRCSTLNRIEEIKVQNITRQNPDAWSYQKLQWFIREKIYQLSRRETEFASFLKHIPLPKSAEASQTQIEDTMEEIWGSCEPLMVSGMRPILQVPDI